MTTQIPGYDRFETLYESARTVVYRAHNPQKGRTEILKVLNDPHPTAQMLMRYRHEYDITRQLHGVGITEVREMHHRGRRVMLVFADVGGTALAKVLERRHFDLEEFLVIAIAATEALGRVHAQGVIHKDLNPSNIVWNEETGEVEIIDFGIATSQAREWSVQPALQESVGTLRYMSPEQTGRTGRRLDYRSDLFSLGATLYELLTGRPACDGHDELDIFHCLLARQPAPPHEVRADVPRAVSRVIMRLLAKTAEERYQGAPGLQRDLQHCLEELRRQGTVEPFVLGEYDVRPTLQVSQQLYGRTSQMNTVLADMDAARNGERVLTLLAGRAGVGKSALVRELQRAIVATRGRFGSAKFDQGRRDQPYSAFAEAFARLINQLLALPDDEIERWRQRLHEAVEANGRLLLDIVPGLDALLDAPPQMPAMEPDEARHRLGRAVRNFVSLFCEPDRPLVLFVDDLQWADPASLELLGALLADPMLQYLHIIGAYRDDEVGPAHPLRVAIAAMRENGASVDQVHLRPLEPEHVTQLVADTLQRPAEEVRRLATLAYEKTSGNPYFLNRFLEHLDARGLLWFDVDQGGWEWDLEAIAEQAMTDNVVDLLITRLRELPEDTQQALQMAGLLGSRFQLETLATVCQQSPVGMYEALEPALTADILLRHSPPELFDPRDIEGPTVVRQLGFPHDRVQEAAAQLMDADERPAAHLKVGRLLDHHRRDSGNPTLLFDVVGHLIAARALLDTDERVHLARLIVEASQRAMSSLAYTSAADLLQVAQELLPTEIWQQDPDLAFQVGRLLGDAESALGRFEQAERRLGELLDHVDDPIKRAEVYRILVRQDTHRSRYQRACEHACAGLGDLGVDLPIDDLDKALDEHMRRVQQRLGDREITAIVDVPRRDDPAREAALRLLGTFQAAAGLRDQRLLVLAGLVAIEISLDIGVRSDTVLAVAVYGVALVRTGQFARADAAAQLSVDLARRFDDDFAFAHAGLIDGGMVTLWTRPLDESIAVLADAHRAGMRSGNLQFAGYALAIGLFQRFCRSTPLGDLGEALTQGLALGLRTNNRVVIDQCRAIERMVEHLRGRLDDQGFVDGDAPDWSEALLEEFRGFHDDAMELSLMGARGIFHYLYGRPEQALGDLGEVDARRAAMLNTVDVARCSFYKALAHLSCARQARGAERQTHLTHADELRARFQRWAASCPFNFEHLAVILDAERAWLDARPFEAAELYDRGIELARERQFTEMDALANERATRFWLAHHKPRFAQIYLQEARYAYRLWGASAKVAHLEATFAELQPPSTPAEGEATPSGPMGREIDIASVLEAAESITRPIEFDALLTTLMKVVIANAGAERGAFFLRRDKYMELVVEGDADCTPRLVDPAVRLSDWEGGARAAVRYALRTRQPLVVGRALDDERFRHDRYVTAHQVRALLCLPVQEVGELVGVLYLENDLTDDAFTKDRLRVLTILVGHIAASLSKARLYDTVRQEKERFRQLAEHIHEVFWLMDWPSKKIVYVSPAYPTTWGRPQPHLPIPVDQWLEAVVADERTHVAEAIDQQAAQGTYDLVYPIERPSGSRRWIRDRGFPIRSPSGEVYRIAGVAEDITRRHEVQQLKNEFISVVSHELRTPLTPIKGIFEILSRSEELAKSPAHKKMVELGLRNSQRLLALIDDLLDIQRLSLTKITFENEVVDLADVVTEAVQINEPLGHAKQIGFDLHITDAGLKANLDRQRFIQVLTNLMSNAVKFSTPRTTVQITLERHGHIARLSVTDHGPGIPEGARDRIFDKFVQADSSMTRKYGGAGLGLAISQTIVERLGGRDLLRDRGRPGNDVLRGIAAGRGGRGQLSRCIDDRWRAHHGS